MSCNEVSRSAWHTCATVSCSSASFSASCSAKRSASASSAAACSASVFRTCSSNCSCINAWPSAAMQQAHQQLVGNKRTKPHGHISIWKEHELTCFWFRCHSESIRASCVQCGGQGRQGLQHCKEPGFSSQTAGNHTRMASICWA